ncbi:MAG: protein kinase [Candidatus Eiseniibacteriota bacterium]|nr:MAG: protein kinase [Candidatus Eisenbacteria bacterium]
MIGNTISHYKIVEKLGEGGMGVVYMAEDTDLKRRVALKFLSSDLVGNEEAKQRFIGEARTASALDHPNVCNIHEIGQTDDGRLFIVMAFYVGQPLTARIAEGPLNFEQATDIAAQIASGLSEAHNKGIVHRDITPSNIMVTDDGIAKILDFGLAVLAEHKGPRGPGTAAGTAAYMSPEQARGEEGDHRTDIWSLGVVLYEMLAGHPPFGGEYEAAVLYSLLNEQAPALSSLRGDLPEGIDSVITKALAKNRNDRYQSMTEMLADLQSARDWQFIASWEQRETRSDAVAKSIAVLPFVSFSDSKEDEFFSDGTTEDIIIQLSKIAELRVVSRTSIMRYKHTEKNLREIGRELNVGAIVEGSVRRSGDCVRIVAQLVDAKTDEHLWAEKYDRDMKDIFAIQSDVAEKIASALRAELSAAERTRIERKPTENMEAYEYYLKGREYYYRYRKHDNETAIALFSRALELDPDYALAWAGLADAYAQGFERYGMPASWSDCALESGKKAVELDGGSAEAYKALGLAYDVKGCYRKAFEAYLKATQLNPNYVPAVLYVGGVHVFLGELDTALAWLKRAISIDPAAVFAPFLIGDVYRQLGEFEKAQIWLKRALELQPDLVVARYSQATLCLLQGAEAEARGQMKKAVSSNPDDPRAFEFAGVMAELTGDAAAAEEFYRRSIDLNPSFQQDWMGIGGIGLGHLLMKAGKYDESKSLLAQARKIREEQISCGDDGPFSRYNIARTYAIEGNRKEAYVWLDKAIEAGWRDYQMGSIDPWLENLRGEEKFRKLMAQVRAKVDEMKARVEAE